MPVKIVKPFLLVGLTLLIFLANCSFQINRNRISLPEGAQSISLSQISNQSFTPGLDIILKEILNREFSRNSIPVKSKQKADLQLGFQITQSQLNIEKIILNSQTSYHHQFIISGKFFLIDGKKGIQTKVATSLTGSFLLESAGDKATEREVAESRLKALINLGKKITEKLTQNF